MTFRRILAPLLGAAFLVMAALLGAGVANAHPGHAHAGGGAEPAAAASEVSPSIDDAAIAIALADMVAAETGRPAPPEVGSATTLHFQVAIEAGRGAPDAPCRGICCDNTPCGGCVNMAFGKTSLPSPLLGARLRAPLEARKLAGRLAEGPNEPPRPFI